MYIMEKRELQPVTQESEPLAYTDASKAVATVLAPKLDEIKTKAGDRCVYRYFERKSDGGKDWYTITLPSLADLNPYNSQSVMRFLQSDNKVLRMLHVEGEKEIIGLLDAYYSLPERYGSVVVERGYHSFVVNDEVPQGDLAMMPDLGRYVDSELQVTEDISPAGADAMLGLRTFKRVVGSRTLRKNIATTATAVETLGKTVADPIQRAIKVNTGIRAITDRGNYQGVWTAAPGDVIRDALQNCVNPDHLWLDELRGQVIWLAKLSDARDDLNEKWTMAGSRQKTTGNSEQEQMDQWRNGCLQIEEMMRTTLYIIKSKTKARQQQAKLEDYMSQFDGTLSEFMEITDAEVRHPQSELLNHLRHSVADAMRSVENPEPGYEDMFNEIMKFVRDVHGKASEPAHVQSLYQKLHDDYSDKLPLPTWNEFYESFQKTQASLA